MADTVDEAMAERMSGCAAAFPPGEREPEAVGFAPAACAGTDVPRIAEAPASLACRTHRVETVGHHRLVLGEVLGGTFREGLVNPDRWHVDFGAFSPPGRMGDPRPSPDAARRPGW